MTEKQSKYSIRFDVLPLGTRFRYIGGRDVWVKIENGGTGVIAKWDGPTASNILQSICIAAETEQERATLEVELAEASQPECDCWERVKTLIVEGPLPGNGRDKTAERNGIILAANHIAPWNRNQPTGSSKDSP